MAATERTPLTRPTDSPGYVEFSTLLRARRTRVRQFQCCVCAVLITIFIVTLVVTVSYSVKNNDDVTDATSPTETNSNLLKSVWVTPSLKSAGAPSAALTDGEWKDALLAGQQAMERRRAADAEARPLSTPSPNSRHSSAMSTDAFVGELALGGVGEIAATRRIEAQRISTGRPSSIGAYFDPSWTPRGTCKEFAKLNCTTSKYRTFDGTCNHPQQRGSAMSPFRRILPPDYADGLDAPRTGKFGEELPSAREVSLRVHPPSPSRNLAFTVMLAVFGQFLDHDITATAISQGKNGSSLACCPPSTGHPECFPVRVGPGDPVYDIAGSSCMEFVRSAPAPQCKMGSRQQLTQVSAFIDGSTIYGSDPTTAYGLREGSGGRLRMQTTADNRTLLPASTNPNDGCNRIVESERGRYCFATGDGRANENLHLTTMHLLWARQHNAIAAELARVNHNWDDETIYRETRRIVGAQFQHIAYNEFVPVVLGEREMDLRNLRPLASGYRNDYNVSTDPTIANSFAAAAFRFGHTLLPGLMRVTDAQSGTSSYVELHKMLFNPYSLYAQGGVESSVMAATSNVVQKTSTHVTAQLTEHLFEDPLANQSVPCGLDLVSLNIQRGRDHGIPGYVEWRQYCGLSRTASFSDLKGDLDPDALDEISKLYASVDDVDLYTGALAEVVVSDGLVGPTFTCLIADQFERLQRGDRYWYETSEWPQAFTKEQLKELRKTSLAKLICNCADSVTQIQPEVMRSVGPDNPILSCEDIAGPSFEAWSEGPSARLMLKPPAIPADWVNFKIGVNDTIRNIVSFIDAHKPPPGSPDWLAFQDYMNASFADLRNQLSGLHPKAPLQATESEGYGDFDGLANGLLKETKDFVLRLSGQTTVYDDWVNFKKEINQSLSDAIGKIRGTLPTEADWLAFKDSIASQFVDIKSRIAEAKLKLSLEKAADYDFSAYKTEWVDFKNEIVKSVNDVVDRIGDSMPPPGDPTWASFADRVAAQFASIKDRIPVVGTELPLEKSGKETTLDQWTKFKTDIVNSLNETIETIRDNMPPPGDPKWTAFRAKVADQFANIEYRISILKPGLPVETAVKATAGAATAMDDWTKFKADLIASVSAAVRKIKDNAPPPGDPSWTSFRGEVVSQFADIKDRIPLTKLPRATLKASGIFDWVSFKNQINKTITDIIEDVRGDAPPPGDPGWAKFKDRFNDTFANFKNDAIKLRKPPTKVAFQQLTEDWLSFEKQINGSLTEALENIEAREPLPVDAAWAAFRDSVADQFADIGNEVASIKTERLLAMRSKPSDDVADERGKTEEAPKNKESLVKSLPRESEDLRALEDSTNRSFADIKRSVLGLKPDPSSPVIPAIDWATFKSEINETVMSFVSALNRSRPAEWIEFKGFVEKSLADLRSEIASLKSAAAASRSTTGAAVKKVGAIDQSKKSRAKSGKLVEGVDNPINFDASIAKNSSGADWLEFREQVSEIARNLLKNASKSGTTSDGLRRALLEASNKFASLKPEPFLKTTPDPPADWSPFLGAISNAISDVVEEIALLKPSAGDATALRMYENSVAVFFDELRNVVEEKEEEFAESIASSSSPEFFNSYDRVIIVHLLIAVTGFSY